MFTKSYLTSLIDKGYKNYIQNWLIKYQKEFEEFIEKSALDGKKKAEFFYIEKEPISDNILYKLIEHLQELYPELKIDLIDFNIECKLTLYDKIYGVYITIDWE